MLNTEQIKQQITQGEPLVREFAIQYFLDSYSRDPELMPLVLESCTLPEYWGHNRLALLYAKDFVHSPETVDQLVRQMLKADRTELDVYQRVFAECPVSLLRLHEAHTRKLPGGVKKIAQQRMELVDASTTELVDKLYAHTERAEGKYINEFDYPYGKYIVKELVTRDDVDTDKLLAPLLERFGQIPEGTTYDSRVGFDLNYTYLHIYLVIFAGERCVLAAVPALINALRCDGDFLHERAVDALAQIGKAEVIEGLQANFAEQSWIYRLYVSSLFGKIKLEASEQALLSLLPIEKDMDIKTNLADSLCQLLSRKGMTSVWKVIVDGYDRMMLDLHESLYINYVMHGLDLPPKLIEWKKERNKPQDKFREEIDFLSSFIPTPSTMPPIPPVKKTKIDRNEPCICGSGKKYKKCCDA